MLGKLNIRTKLLLLLGFALSILAITRGLGLVQLGGYLDRMSAYTTTLDALHQQLESAHEKHIERIRSGVSDAAAQSDHQLRVNDLRTQLATRRSEWETVHARERTIMTTTYAAMLLLVFVVGGGIYWFLMAAVVRPLQGVVSVANVVAAGDLTTEISVKSTDEIGTVMQALHHMNGSLAGVIGKIRAVSLAIDRGTVQISDAGDSLSRHVQAQADFLQKTTATLRELAAAVTSNAENADRAREVAAKAREVAIRGGGEVAIRGGGEVDRAVDTMGSISASSQKVVDIVSIIDGITFQTNILALNAAVEAARAGEQGRSFAVVASEVRSLAQRSASAAKEIAALINDSVRELREGSGIVEKAGATMTQIVNGARAVDDIMVKMSEDATQQLQVIEHVRETVNSVDQSNQQQALLADAAQAVEALRQQAQALTATVSVFQLREAERAGALVSR